MIGLHFNGLAAPPPPAGTEQPPEEQAWRRAITAFFALERAYFDEQQRKPQTVAFALADNPLGTAAWIVEKLKGWSDAQSELEPPFTKDRVLTNVMLYLVTNTAPTSVWFYRGALDDPPMQVPRNGPVPARVTDPDLAERGPAPFRPRAAAAPKASRPAPKGPSVARTGRCLRATC